MAAPSPFDAPARALPEGLDASLAARAARPLASSARSRVWALTGPDGRVRVVKLTDPHAARREARSLTLLTGTGLAPALIAHGDGVLVSAHHPGVSEPLTARPIADAARVGALLARVHAHQRHPTGSWDGWDHPAHSLGDYRRRRADQIRALWSESHPPIPASASSEPPVEEDSPGRRDRPFAFVHGDAWSGNILWQAVGEPLLVDWEFQRFGDPSEELAYLAALDDLDDARVEALLAGYGRPQLAPLVAWWRPRLAGENAAWFARVGETTRAADLVAQLRRLSASRTPR